MHINRQHLRALLLRGVFVRHRPTRLAADEAQALLQRQAIDFVDHAVNLERQGCALRAHVGMELHQRIGPRSHPVVLRHRKAPVLEGLQHGGVSAPLRAALHLANAVGKKAQGPLRRDSRVELAHRTCRRIARIDKGFFALFPCSDAGALARIERLKIRAAHIDLTAHFQHRRRVLQAQRNLADGPDVLRDVFAIFTITACRGLYQHTGLVTKAHGQAVELQLSQVLHRRGAVLQFQLFADARIKSLRAAGTVVGFGADAEHRHRVAHGGKAVEQAAAHALGGRIGRAQLRMFGLQGL